MDAFQRLLVGTVYVSPGNPDFGLYANSTIMDTALFEMPELQFLAETATAGSLKQLALGWEKHLGLVTSSFSGIPASNAPLSRTLEQMFQNFTSSLMSSQRLRYA